MKRDLQQRLFDFAVSVIKTVRLLPRSSEYRVISYQLCKSATSSGANYEEARAASSRPDFIYKTEIALREMKESNYWLRIILAVSHDVDSDAVFDSVNELALESSQLSKILASIIIRAKQKDGAEC
ncbi:MAG: four helix bundle protein [Prosthecochloris sp.]|nr:four helix bundle protein [Prosthecochloris sp.]